jgi:hypothetical protein
MTLPVSGQIGISDISQEIGEAATFSTDLNFLNGLLRSDQRPATPSLSAFYNKTYFQNNNEGNCNNGNCANNCNCGNIGQSNCFINGTVNCANCDAQAWLQTNCNCACTYNCSVCTGGSTNCNCNCACDCFWSDDTLKDREGNIENALDIVDQLDGFFYRGNQQAARMGLNTQLDAGVSAQQVEQAFPVAMGNTVPGTQIKQVRYERLVPLLIEAVKQLRKQVNSKK